MALSSDLLVSTAPPSKPHSREAYWKKKKNLKKKQMDSFIAVTRLPPRAQASALFGLWPERLPQIVSAMVEKNVLKNWRKLRSKKHDVRWNSLADKYYELKDEAIAKEYLIILNELHGQEAKKMCDVIETLKDLNRMTVALGPDNDSYNVVVSFVGKNESERRAEMMSIFVKALHTQAGIHVRQTLPLRVQVKDSEGQNQWVPQERIYGLTCFGGRWASITEAQVRYAYNHRADGSVFPKDPRITYGCLQSAIRKVVGKAN